MENNVSLVTIRDLKEETKAYRALVYKESEPTAEEIQAINNELKEAAHTTKSKSFTCYIYPIREEQPNYSDLDWLHHVKALLQQRGFRVTLSKILYDADTEHLVVTWTL